MIRGPDKIIGKKIIYLLEQARRNRGMLKIKILGTGYEGLTIVTRIDSGNSPSFLVDCPGNAGEIIKNSKGKRVIFEFSGEDKIQYSFRTYIVHIEKEDLRIELPETIERMQRRNHFRITVPPGTVAIFRTMNKRYDFNVVDLSEGGTLLNQKACFHDSGLLYVGGFLEDVRIVNNEGKQKTGIGIRKAEIKRIEKNLEAGRYDYALCFTEIGKKEQEEIRKFINKCQREMLKRRSFSGEE